MFFCARKFKPLLLLFVLVVLLLQFSHTPAQSSPWSQDRLRSRWSGKILEEKSEPVPTHTRTIEAVVTGQTPVTLKWKILEEKNKPSRKWCAYV